ncbi:unnamed protein product, partial [Symbiodinium pilosum]
DQARVSTLPAWAPLHRFFHQQLLNNLVEIRDIAEGLLSARSEDNQQLQEVRQRLAESLYTFQVAEKVASTLTMVTKKLPRGERPANAAASSSGSGLARRV